MFVEIDDLGKAWELYEAGLLWEGYAHNSVPHCPAYEWNNFSHMERCWHNGRRGAGASGFVFYILLEE